MSNAAPSTFRAKEKLKTMIPGNWSLHLAAAGLRLLLVSLSSSLNNARLSPALHLRQSTCCVGGFMRYIQNLPGWH
jgi:hypothetical protein